MRLMALLILMMVGCAATPDVPSKEVAPFPRTWFWGMPGDLRDFDGLVGAPMPALSLDRWVGEAVRVEAVKGKVVVIDFFATWCPPCIEAVPKNNELYERFREKGVVMIGVCTSNIGQDNLPAFAREHPMKYPVAADPGSKTMQAWRVKTFPTYAVVDKHGRVRAVGLRHAFLPKAIEALLAE